MKNNLKTNNYRTNKIVVGLTFSILAGALVAPLSADEPPITPVVTSETTTLAAPPASLLSAVQLGDIEAVKTALAGEADVNQRDAEGKTALMWATGTGRTDLVNALLEKGAEVNAVDNYGRTALHYVMAAGQGGLGTPPKKKKGGLGKALGTVATIGGGILSSGMLGMMGGGLLGGLGGSLLSQGLGQAMMGQGMGGMMGMGAGSMGGRRQAIMGGNMPGMQTGGAYSMSGGMGVDFQTMDAATWTSMLEAMSKSGPQALDSFAQLAPKMDEKQKADWKAFAEAGVKGDQAAVQKLLDSGTMKPIFQQFNQTLQVATNQQPVMDGGVGVAQALLAKGADITIKDKEGQTAQKAAQTRGMMEVSTLLQRTAAAAKSK